jgi:hypothetical protein
MKSPDTPTVGENIIATIKKQNNDNFSNIALNIFA